MDCIGFHNLRYYKIIKRKQKKKKIKKPILPEANRRTLPFGESILMTHDWNFFGLYATVGK
jgi:hypothetical protein